MLIASTFFKFITSSNIVLTNSQLQIIRVLFLRLEPMNMEGKHGVEEQLQYGETNLTNSKLPSSSVLFIVIPSPTIVLIKSNDCASS
jgi:hypothetical protein